ncbi:MAG: hypothetical protein LBM71_05650 [Elusimicrobiota bacterium]|jgi:hypothetical protein|nr:hypothetical protein [Elusimicrobiota bacterium]
MSFKSLLNKTCVIEVLSTTPCPSSGQPLESWLAAFSGVKCRLRSRSVSERRYGAVEYQKSTHALYTAFLNLGANNSTSLKRKRVLLEGVYYNVVGFIDMGGRDKCLCFYLERVIE